MPDHVHLLLTPANGLSLERVMQFIKGGFSYRLDERGSVWQPSFTNHPIRDWEDYEQHRDYIRMNPVRARLASTPKAYSVLFCGGGVADGCSPTGLKPAFMGRL